VRNLKKFILPASVHIINGQSHFMMGINNVHVETSLGVIKTIENVLFVLRLRKSLLLIGSIANQGYYVVLDDKICFNINKHFHKVVVVRVQNGKNGLYKLDIIIIFNNS
jgi:hypothetical protein